MGALPGATNTMICLVCLILSLLSLLCANLLPEIQPEETDLLFLPLDSTTGLPSCPPHPHLYPIVFTPPDTGLPWDENLMRLLPSTPPNSQISLQILKNLLSKNYSM